MTALFTSGKSSDWLSCLHQQAIDSFCRFALVLSGDKEWCHRVADQIIKREKFESVLTVSDDVSAGLPFKQARTQLGKEYEAIVFDAWQQFDVDALGAVAGTLCGGGVFILLLPDECHWLELKTSRFLQRSLPLLKKHKGVYFVEQNKALPEIEALNFEHVTHEPVELPYRTPEQKQVVNAIKNAVINKYQKPVVLVSDRGRGKSSALGLVAGSLIQQGVRNIIVTGPRLSMSEPLFRHAQQVLNNAVINRGELSWHEGKLKFVAPDALLIDQPDADLLLVDEAAAIPLSMLEKMLQLYPGSVFATTIHGYEGTGRGFVLKFYKVLEQLSPGWQLFNMTTPVRWAIDDPVESWVDRLLCLDAELAVVPDINLIDIEQCRFEILDRDQLLENNEKLSSIFSLLVGAHYRTQPSDLRHLLDDPEVRLYALMFQQFVVAVALINQEGGLSQSLAADIYRGDRRPQGHLLAQTLTFHAGCEQAATLNYARIMRVAVHPQLQGRGLGSMLIKNIIEKEKLGVDAIGTSFGATTELLHFWQKAGFEIVRLGFTLDHASGTHSAVMLMPFSEKGDQVFADVRKKFQHYLSAWLAGPLRQLSADIRSSVEKDIIDDTAELTEQDWKDIRSFAYAHRGYESCMWPIRKMLDQYPMAGMEAGDRTRQILQIKVLENNSWPDTVKRCQLSGKAEAIQLLRKAVSSILAHCQTGNK